MDENIDNKINTNIKPIKTIIRISKTFHSNSKIPHNIMILTKGKNEIHCNLTQKINQKNILETLKTIQTNPLFENDNNQKVFTSYKYQMTDKNTQYLGNNTFQKNKTSQYIHKLKLIDSNILKKNNKSIPNIYNIKTAEIDKIKEIKRQSTLKPKNNQRLSEVIGTSRQKESERQLIKEDSYLTDNKNDNKYNDAVNQRPKRNLTKNFSKKEMTGKNSQNFIQFSQVDNNIDKISGLINIKDNKSLYEKDKLSNIIDKYSKISVNDKQCFLCERMYSFLNICYAKCNIHFFCKDCLKIYCQNIIEKGIKKMKCPMFKCDYEIDNIILEKILDQKYSQILFGLNNFYEEENTINDERAKYILINKKENNILEDKIQNYDLYHRKNVLQVDSGISLPNIKKYEEEICPNCKENGLFCLLNTFYNKCLNCGYKSCKFCCKKYTNIHLIMNDPNHCKVYYRKRKDDLQNTNNICFKIIIQMLYTIGIYLIMICFCFLIIKKFIFVLFKIGKNKMQNTNLCVQFIKYLFSYFFSFLIYIIIFLFQVIMIPFFPAIIALFDC